MYMPDYALNYVDSSVNWTGLYGDDEAVSLLKRQSSLGLAKKLSRNMSKGSSKSKGAEESKEVAAASGDFKVKGDGQKLKIERKEAYEIDPYF